jgi:hypothetical protein
MDITIIIIIIIIIIMTSADLAHGTEQKRKPKTDPADDHTVMSALPTRCCSGGATSAT